MRRGSTTKRHHEVAWRPPNKSKAPKVSSNASFIHIYFSKNQPSSRTLSFKMVQMFWIAPQYMLFFLFRYIQIKHMMRSFLKLKPVSQKNLEEPSSSWIIAGKMNNGFIGKAVKKQQMVCRSSTSIKKCSDHPLASEKQLVDWSVFIELVNVGIHPLQGCLSIPGRWKLITPGTFACGQQWIRHKRPQLTIKRKKDLWSRSLSRLN